MAKRLLILVLGVAAAGVVALVAVIAIKGDRPHLTPGNLKTAVCPRKAENCRSVRGRIVFIQKVDPDGDGDVHLVTLSRQSVTGPGISVIKLRPRVQPHPLPGIGDSVAAAGPLEKGAKGEQEVHALRVHLARD